VFQQENIIHFNSSPVSKNFVIEYSSSYISSLYTAIWHPPKIA
jgi:hypothetical protein